MKFKFAAVWLCLVCIGIFILQSIIPGFTETFQLSQPYIEVWRFLTAIFLHASIAHILYNMFALVLFGSILEGIIGPRRFLGIFILSGVLANIIASFFYSSSLGASGAIFGVIGTLVVLRPKMTVWAYSLPMPMFVAAILWVGGDLLGAVAFLSGSPIGSTGNIAHLVGVFAGLFYGAILRKEYTQQQIVKPGVYIDEGGMRRWEDNFMR